MKNNERVWLWGIIGFLLGVVATVFVASNAVNNNDTSMMQMMGMRTQMLQKNNDSMMGHDDDEMSMGMSEMTDELKGKTGDDFDNTFIKLMIVHHQGAINMANEAKKSAGHDEIRNLAEDIITAQTKEIEMMKEWQKSWGY